MRLQQYDPPGFLDELNAGQRAAWSRWISRRVDAAIEGDPANSANDSPRPQFYNETKTDTADDKQNLVITWTAFPRNVAITSSSDEMRWRMADSTRDVQDEYCEWSVTRDPQSRKITRVTFTSEGPEYWEFLAAFNPDLLLSLYRDNISPQVRMKDLFDSAGRYRRRNVWNNSTTNGAMHLIQPANTLGAEIELAAAASIVRVINGVELTGEQELIACGRYGDEERNSDPHIGGQVNRLARAKADVTIANPVALYINDLNTAGWETPDESDAKDYWKIVRPHHPDGRPELALRAVFEVPADKGFTVGDILIGGVPIEFGAQIADFITIKIVGLACRFNQSTAAPQTACRQPAQADADDAADAVAAFDAGLAPSAR